MKDAGVARADLDRAHESTPGERHGQDEVAEHIAALGRQRPGAVGREDQIGRAERPSVGEDRRRGQIRFGAFEGALLHPSSQRRNLRRSRRRSPLKVPWPSTGGQGGITRALVTLTICRARRRTSAYDISGNGPAPPSWWHGAQCVKTIGATSRVKVTGLGRRSRGSMTRRRGCGRPHRRRQAPAPREPPRDACAGSRLSQVRDLAAGRRRGDQRRRLAGRASTRWRRGDRTWSRAAAGGPTRRRGHRCRPR